MLFYFKWNNNDAGYSIFVRYIIVYKNMSQILLRQAKKPWFPKLFYVINSLKEPPVRFGIFFILCHIKINKMSGYS